MTGLVIGTVIIISNSLENEDHVSSHVTWCIDCWLADDSM